MISPDDYLALAERLAREQTEADWRTAISRAYYAAFHAGRLLLRDLGFRVPRASAAHAYVWMRLSNCGDPSIVKAGGELNNMQGDRNRADYDFQRDYVQSDAQVVVQTARVVVQAISTGLVEPTRSQITAAIRDYERNVLGSVTWQGP
jgi:uncharacterized protein (UPF0332 family)